MKCSNCKNETETIYCEHCGMDIVKSVKEEYEDKLSSRTKFYGYELESKKKTLKTTVIIFVVIVLLQTVFLFMYNEESNSLDSKVTELELSYSELELDYENDMREKEDTIDTFITRIEEVEDNAVVISDYADYLEKRANFLDNYIGIVTTTGEKYHKYGCQYIDGKDFYAYNTENAVAKGYEPCSVCYD